MKEPMRTKTKVLSITALVAGGVVFGMILAGSLDLTRHAAAEKPVPAAAATAGRAPAVVALPSFADIAEQVTPAIVSVTATDIIKPDKQQVPYHGMGDGEGSPFDFFFGPRGRGQGQDETEDRKELSGGTGFIIEPDGFILTNNHVIENAEKIEVRIGEKNTFKAKVVGRDPATDLALLKIEGGPFPTVKLGDSDRLRVGEWVMAIGDPLQFDKSVTVGVISGKGRYAGLSRATSAFESLLQTDAAINFGNSGGPLVNVNGEVIGINTAISRFAQNIGFAVPINVAKRLLPQLKKGKVVRGFLGVSIADVNESMREALSLKSADGALVQSVEKGKPGDKAGLRHEDVILRVDETPVKSPRDLIDYVSSKPPGAKVTILYLREGKERTTIATLQTREEEGEAAAPGGESEDKSSGESRIGIRKGELTAALRRTYRIDRDVEAGVVITHVKPVSTAADAGLAEGDVIVEVNGAPVSSEADFDREMKKGAKGKYVRFYIHRTIPRPQSFIAAVKLED
jgi:serine protease Do